MRAPQRSDLPPPLTGSVPATFVRLLFDYLAGQSCLPERVLGAPAPAQEEQSAYPVQRWRAMLAAAARHLGDPALGLRVGASITPAHLGPLGYVLLASQSVPAALARYMQYQALMRDASPVRLEITDGKLTLSWSRASRGIGLLANQCGLAALVQFARDITDVDVVPLAVDFVEPRPDDVQVYAALFRCPVLFGQAATRVMFSADVLALPLRRPDPALATMLEQQVRARYAALPCPDHMLQAIRQQISSHLPEGEPKLDQVAEKLHISGRTLRRWLKERDWSFRALLEDTRWHMAEHYLCDPRLGLAEVALLLGYSEQSAFSRAFLRWSGMTPRRWRLETRP